MAKDFGLEVALHVKKPNSAELGKEVQAALDATGRKYYVELKRVKITNAVIKPAKDKIQTYFDNNSFKIDVKVRQIDAKAAVENVRKQLAGMVEAFRLDNGVNIKGIGNFTDGAYESASQRRAERERQAADATRDTAEAEGQVLTEAEATTRELTRQEQLLRGINEAMRKLSSFRKQNPSFSGGEGQDGRTAVEQTAYNLDTLKGNAQGVNAANTAQMDEYTRQLAEANKEISAYNAQVTETGRAEAEATLDLDPLIDKLDILSSKYASLKGEGKVQYAMPDGTTISASLSEVEAAIAKLRTEYSQLATGGTDSMRQLQAEADLVEKGLNDIDAAIKRAAQVEKIDLTGLNNRYNQALVTANGLTNNSEFLSELGKIKVDIDKLSTSTKSFSDLSDKEIKELIATYQLLGDKINKVKADMNVAAQSDPSAGNVEAQSATQNLNFLRQIQSSAKSARDLLSNNTKLYGTDLGRSLQGLIGDYDNFITKVKESPPQTKAAFNEYQSEFAALKERLASLGLEMEKTGVQGNTLFTRFANGIKKFGGWTIVTRALTSVIRLGKQMVTNVKEIDSAMTQLRIVTNASGTEMEKYGDKIAASAKKIGASITDLTDSATTYARLGYSLEESTSLAEYTSMLKAVGDIDVSDAQDAITAITKAFDIDASQIEGVMDKLVTVGKHSCPTAWQHAA